MIMILIMGMAEILEIMVNMTTTMMVNGIIKARVTRSENNRAKSALQIINTNYFTSVQVKQMLQMFSLESNKLNLAEQAYSKTIDQRNYFTINDVFSLSSSKDELTRFIRSH